MWKKCSDQPYPIALSMNALQSTHRYGKDPWGPIAPSRWWKMLQGSSSESQSFSDVSSRQWCVFSRLLPRKKSATGTVNTGLIHAKKGCSMGKKTKNWKSFFLDHWNFRVVAIALFPSSDRRLPQGTPGANIRAIRIWELWWCSMSVGMGLMIMIGWFKDV